MRARQTPAEAGKNPASGAISEPPQRQDLPMSEDYPLRPFLPADAMALRDLFAQSIDELTADDYDEDQRLAWVSSAEDAAEFRAKLGDMLTLVVQLDGEYLGFGSLKDNKTIDMLYVHPDFAGEGVGTALADALEKIAAARGAEAVTADVSDTAIPFFERRGYIGAQRNSIPLDDQWLSNTTMIKRLAISPNKPPAAKPS
jgi:putative acetyltransferase